MTCVDRFRKQQRKYFQAPNQMQTQQYSESKMDASIWLKSKDHAASLGIQNVSALPKSVVSHCPVLHRFLSSKDLPLLDFAYNEITQYDSQKNVPKVIDVVCTSSLLVLVAKSTFCSFIHHWMHKLSSFHTEGLWMAALGTFMTTLFCRHKLLGLLGINRGVELLGAVICSQIKNPTVQIVISILQSYTLKDYTRNTLGW